MIYILIYLAIVNLIGAILVASDKSRARRKQWRISEKMLFIVAIIGGSIGVYLTMKAVRHKTKHKRFMIGLPIIIILQFIFAAVYYLIQAGVIKL